MPKTPKRSCRDSQGLRGPLESGFTVLGVSMFRGLAFRGLGVWGFRSLGFRAYVAGFRV